MEFLFLFNDKWRADGAAEAVRAWGYDARVLPADGEGRTSSCA